jgi:hypothetical protein
MRVTLAALAALLFLAGCGAESGSAGGGDAVDGGSQPAAQAPASKNRPPEQSRRPETVAAAHCPPGLPSCRSTEGRIVYVERVDPDGDGDAHFVVADRQGITLPGLTAIDVRKGLRPHPLPEAGDLISAAGPVQTGSYGQSQIHALELHVAVP